MENKRTRKLLIAVIIIALILAAILVYDRISASKITEQLDLADASAANGEYAQACTIYEEYREESKFQDRIKESFYKAAEDAKQKLDYDPMVRYYTLYEPERELNDLYAEAGDAYYDLHEYERAAEYYQLAKHNQKAKKAWLADGDAKAEANDLEGAIESYGKAENSIRQRAAQTELGNQYLEQHNWEKAIEYFKEADADVQLVNALCMQADEMIENGEGAKVPRLLQDYSGSSVAETVFRAARAGGSALPKEEAAKLAGDYGSHIRHTDTQLKYCQLLYDAGYDLGKVYPDGVEVLYDLSKFEYPFDVDTLSSKGADLSNVAVFSWIDEKPKLDPVESRDEADAPVNIASTVKYHPELMVAAGEKILPFLNNYSTIVIMRSMYAHSGTISIRTSQSYNLGQSYNKYRDLLGALGGSTKYYRHYTAVEVIYLCDSKTGETYSSYDGYINAPLAFDSVVGNAFLDILLTTDQVVEIQTALLSEDSEESQKILKKYTQTQIDTVRESEDRWGDYIRFYYDDADGKKTYFDGTSKNVSTWNTEKFMLGTFEEGWMEQQIEEDAVSNLIFFTALEQDLLN